MKELDIREVERRIPADALAELKQIANNSLHVLIGEQCLNSEVCQTMPLQITVEQLEVAILASMEYGYLKGVGK
jgi:hypothetical protein